MARGRAIEHLLPPMGTSNRFETVGEALERTAFRQNHLD